MALLRAPSKQGLYDPAFEHDACGLGFVANVKGLKSHGIVRDALQVLRNLEHRGASGWEENSGDGAGILLQTPHDFLLKECSVLGIRLPEFGSYGVGIVFLPVEDDARRECEVLLEKITRQEGQQVLGWRDVPTNNETLGSVAIQSKPAIRQVFIARSPDIADHLDFERKLYVIRKLVTKEIKRLDKAECDAFYICSLSFRTVVYKGMLTTGQLSDFYPDLVDPALTSALAIVHSRFSTNTFPSWSRAHPYRFLAHNGEINTLRGNVSWMRARESVFASRLFGDDMAKVLPVIDEQTSDSGMLDSAVELLTLSGRSIQHSMAMLIPEPWSNNESMSDEKRAFYEYHSFLTEPWDGPAAVAFTDGVNVGALVDRNGLRPARYYVTNEGVVVLASEVGVLDVPAEKIVAKGQLAPGRMLLIDTQQGRIIGDGELKESLASANPYRQWLDENTIRLDQLPEPPYFHRSNFKSLLQRQKVFGYSKEDIQLLINEMAATGHEPIGSMGTDTPLAILSERPQLLYNYFKQLFAQVTNPPIDGLREELMMSTDTSVGPEANILEPTGACARQIKLSSPILTNSDLERLRLVGDSDSDWGRSGFRSITLSAVYRVSDGGGGLAQSLDELCQLASTVISSGYEVIILSDRDVGPEMAPIPALLAVSNVHHHLIREGTRTQVGLIVESGEPREVHHFALLIGYGAAAINPYLVFETLEGQIARGLLPAIEFDVAVANYVEAVNAGLIKVISKMGISTVQGYCGAQVFEAIGIDETMIVQYFTDTPSRIGGIGLDGIAEEVRVRHSGAFQDTTADLGEGGQYRYRSEGEIHLFNPRTIHNLQRACRNADYKAFREYSSDVNDHSKHLCTIRGLLDIESHLDPVPLEEVEPASSIVTRFKTGAMSYGSISAEAHESLAIAMNNIGGRSNTGEGGEDPERYITSHGENRNSKIKQIASGRFGVTSQYLINAEELQIKIAQGAKPGEGGQLPGHKVYPWIARVRHSTPGVGLISPPPHHDIYSIEDLAQLIFDLRNANPTARISVKLVAETGVGTIAAGVVKAQAGVVLISGHDGGTGAAPLTSIKHAGAPWELGLAETHQTLLLNNLRSRVRLETDGQLKTGRDVVIAALLGADEFGFATAPLVALGCIMMRACHLNTCPVGIATQDPRLREYFTGEPRHVVNFMMFIAEEVRELMASLGFRRFADMVGRNDLLKQVKTANWKADQVDLSRLLHSPVSVTAFQERASNGPSLDQQQLLPICGPALDHGQPVSASFRIRNVNRAVGTTLGSEITRQYGPAGLPTDTIQLRFDGSAGQSFGAFIPKGLALTLVGDANDYVGKGMSGGKIVVMPPEVASFTPEENAIVGNVCFYGATAGEAYIYGMAGQRFCVRNSGANVVVEAVGDHGCEYMTGGRVVVLGNVGRNFAAGMSGGIAYLFDDSETLLAAINQDMVSLTRLQDEDETEYVKSMVFRHAELTGSRRAADILIAWDQYVSRIVRVLPNDYAKVIGDEQVKVLKSNSQAA